MFLMLPKSIVSKQRIFSVPQHTVLMRFAIAVTFYGLTHLLLNGSRFINSRCTWKSFDTSQVRQLTDCLLLVTF